MIKGRGNNRHEGGDTFLRRTLLPALALSFVLLVALIADPLSVLALGKKQAKAFTYIDADKFIDKVVDGERISFYYDNVVIDRDTLTANCDTLIHYRDRKVVEFLGNVHLVQNATTVDCRRAVYSQTYGTGDFYGGVRIVEGDIVGTGLKAETREFGRYMTLIGHALLVTPDYTVRGDTITRDRETGRGEAFSNVRIMEPASSNLITGEHAVFLADGDIMEVDIDPVFTSREQGGATFFSEAGVMQFFRQENKVVMIDSVRIRQGSTHAQGDTATAYGQEHLVLTGTPEVTSSMKMKNCAR